MKRTLFTSESVTEGHPDKICDKVSDAILDTLLENDPLARVACEVLVTTGLVMVAGEVTTSCYVDIEKTVRQAVREIGYSSARAGFCSDTCAVVTSLKGQSPDIAQGVDVALEVREGVGDDAFTLGAGDQGMMFGFACDETDDLMPMPIYLAHKLSKRLAYVRKEGELDYLLPDGKSQVTVEYEGNEPKRITNIVLAAQHIEDVSQSVIHTDLSEQVIKPVIPESLLDDETKCYINATGRFVIGGPQGDCGLTGRKIIVDTYGGYARHGGGSFSGKDPTKVDRSGAYMARYVAKNIVASGAAKRCEVQLAYAIGVAEPMCVNVDTFGTGQISDSEITRLVRQNFDLRPMSIIKYLNLRRPIYQQVAAYGHFGRMDLDLPWEKTDKAQVFSR